MEVCAESQGEFPSTVLPGAVLSGLFLFCILGHSGEEERLIYDTLRAVAGTLSPFFFSFLSPSLSLCSSSYPFPHLTKLPLALEHPSYGYHVTGWQMLGHSWEQKEEREQ